MIPGLALVAVILVQRLAELWLSARNTRALRARGAREVGAGHYPLIVAFHALWLAAMAWIARDAALVPLWTGVYGLLQAFRLWILASLGARWTTRILVLDEPLVARGPYRHLRHPNYLLVACEVPVVALALGAPLAALGFGLANLAVLAVRLRAEEAALSPSRARPGPPEQLGPPER